MDASSGRPAAGGCWRVWVVLGAVALAACVSDGHPRTTAPSARTTPSHPDPVTSMGAPEAAATASAAGAVRATATEVARPSPEQAMVTGLAAAPPAFQGGSLTGPLGTVELEQRQRGAIAAARLQPAAGIGVQARPGGLAGSLDLGPAVQIDAASDAERRRLAAAAQIARGLSLGAASEGDMSRAAIAWRLTQRATLAGTAGADGTRGAGVQIRDRFGLSLEETPNETRQRISVDVVPGLTVETSGALGATGQAPDDRIGLKWRLRY